MTEKRYFKREWEEEYYIFDSQVISEKEFDEKVEYEDYQAFADSMSGDTVVNRLNELYDENQEVSDSIDNRLRYYQEFLENEKRNDRDIMLLQRIVDDLKDLKRIKKGDM